MGQKGSGGLFGLFGSKGADKKLPLLVLHGGPGLPSRYLETLELLAGQGRRVIFYDQVLDSAAPCLGMHACPVSGLTCIMHIAWQALPSSYAYCTGKKNVLHARSM